jgi:ABC-2 type transport system permease protein
MNIVWQETTIHTKIYFRERQAVFWGFVFPLLLLFLFCSIFGGTPERSSALVAGLICINVMAGALFGTGVITVGAREQGILRRYKMAPVSPWKIVTGMVASRFVSITLATVLMLVLARLVYHITLPANIPAALLVYTTGAVMFSALAFVVASLARSVAEANGVSQALFMPMMFLSGATFPFEFMPAWLQKVAHAMPSTYYVSALKTVMAQGGGIADCSLDLTVMAVISALAIMVSARFFRWE